MGTMTAENLEALGKCYLMSGLSPEAVTDVAGIAECGTMLAGESLTEAGQRGCDLFVILEGKVVINTKGGDKLADAGPGSVVGEIALVDDQPRSATVVCAGLVRYARFPAKELRAYMAKNRETGFAMLANLSRVLSMRLRQTDHALDLLHDKTRDPWEHSC